MKSIMLPPPKNWEDFEELCWEVFRKKWNDPSAKKHGRKGQAQNGVDVYGRENSSGEYIGIQCKGKEDYDVSPKKVTKSELSAEAKKALSFEPKIKNFILATTARKDNVIEKEVRLLSQENEESGSFKIDLLAWDDIELEIQSLGLIHWYMEEFLGIRIPKEIDITNDLDAIGMVERFILTFEEHGVKRMEIPSFTEGYITNEEIANQNLLYSKITPNILEWLSRMFGVSKRWLNSGDGDIYELIPFYKRERDYVNFLREITDQFEEIEIISLTPSTTLCMEDENSYVVLLLKAKIGEVNNKNIYRYFLTRDKYNWNYLKTRHQFKLMGYLNNLLYHQKLNLNIILNDYILDDATLDKLLTGDTFPEKVISPFKNTTWNSLDYIKYHNNEDIFESEDFELAKSQGKETVEYFNKIFSESTNFYF